MPRGSDQHGPRVDDELKHEESALLQGESDDGRTEERRTEAPGLGDEVGMGTRAETSEPVLDSPPETESEQLAAFAALFTPSRFPARRDEALKDAREHFAADELLARLSQVPDDVYDTVTDLWDAVKARQ